MAVVTSNAGTPSLVARERTFQVAAPEAGLRFRWRAAGPTSYEAGYATAKALLPGSGRPDAAFCVTDLLACGFMDGARAEFGLSVPDELCVVGFDDIEQAGWSSYELTTFSQPSESIAERIAGLLEASGHGNAGKPRMVFPRHARLAQIGAAAIAAGKSGGRIRIAATMPSATPGQAAITAPPRSRPGPVG